MIPGITDLLERLYETLKTFWYWITEKLFDILSSVWYWIVDKACAAVELLVSAVDFQENLFTGAMDFAGLPTQVIYILNQVHMSTCLTMLFAAITIRVTLNLIPGMFTRV